MRIICPTCASHYEVEVARLAAQGQLVRCARCREVWLARPPEAAPRAACEAVSGAGALVAQATALAKATPEVVDFQAAKIRLRPRAEPAAKTGWASSIGLFAAGAMTLAALAGLHSFRDTIEARVPHAAALYAAAGLQPRNALALTDVRSRLVAENGETVLTLQGRIANTGSKAAAVPDLTVVVRGDAKLPLYTWTAAPAKATLAQGESIAFQSRLASPPSEGRDVRVSFAQAGS